MVIVLLHKGPRDRARRDVRKAEHDSLNLPPNPTEVQEHRFAVDVAATRRPGCAHGLVAHSVQRHPHLVPLRAPMAMSQRGSEGGATGTAGTIAKAAITTVRRNAVVR